MIQVPQMRPWSWQAFLFGVTVVVASAALQGACVVLGAHLYFATFLPSIFIVGVFAGAPAAVFAVVLTIPLVWWAFMPPFFEFNPLTIAHADAINLFLLFSVLLVGLADLCRLTMAIVSRGGLKPADDSAATNP
jgi:hypothetical protein